MPDGQAVQKQQMEKEKMSDENNDPMVDQKKGAEEITELSEEALKQVSGGGFSSNVKIKAGYIPPVD